MQVPNAAAPAPTQSTANAPAPKPAGATPTGPQTPPEPLENKAAAPDPRLAELEKQTKLHARRAHELSTRQKEIETKTANLAKEQAEYEQWKKAREDRRRNPSKYLTQDFGDDWYEKLTKYKLEGAPTGDLIASELDDREEKLRKLVEEKTAEPRKELEQLRAQLAQRQQQEFEASVVAKVKAQADKFPLVDAFAEHGSVLQEIRNHFKATTKQGPDGNWLPGEVLTPEDAAAKVEARIADIASKFEKYFEAKKAKAGPAATPNQSNTVVSSQRNETPQRRALSTTVTASSTSTRPTPRSDREREKAAIAAMEAALQGR
jgi:hypothetical protein